MINGFLLDLIEHWNIQDINVHVLEIAQWKMYTPLVGIEKWYSKKI